MLGKNNVDEIHFYTSLGLETASSILVFSNILVWSLKTSQLMRPKIKT